MFCESLLFLKFKLLSYYRTHNIFSHKILEIASLHNLFLKLKLVTTEQAFLAIKF